MHSVPKDPETNPWPLMFPKGKENPCRQMARGRYRQTHCTSLFLKTNTHRDRAERAWPRAGDPDLLSCVSWLSGLSKAAQRRCERHLWRSWGQDRKTPRWPQKIYGKPSFRAQTVHTQGRQRKPRKAEVVMMWSDTQLLALIGYMQDGEPGTTI